MRLLEIASVTALLPCVLYAVASLWAGIQYYVASVVAVSLILSHLVFEGYRWQMTPAYCVGGAAVVYGSALFYCRMYQTPHFFHFTTINLAGMAALLLVGVAIVLSTAWPIFRLPEPTGPYKVGTHIRHLIDNRRRDAFADDPSSPRELMIQVWYPVDQLAEGPVASYRDKRITSVKDARFAFVETHSILGARLSRSQDRYPVIVYEHSWEGLRTENTAQVEELASRGYVVVGIDHPHSSRITVFPDGRVVYRKFVGEEDYSSQEAFESFKRTADQQVELRAGDVSFVLDELSRLNESDPQDVLTSRLDLDRVGVFGFSLGGTTATEVCRLDRRFVAGLNMDGIIAGISSAGSSPAAFFYMSSDDAPAGEYAAGLDAGRRRQIEFGLQQDARIRRFVSESGGYWMMVRGAKHASFSDAPYSSPLEAWGHPSRIGWILSRYIGAFFDKYLKGIDHSLLDGPSPDMPEVRFEVRAKKGRAVWPGR